MKTAVITLAVINIIIAATLWYLWETPGYVVSMNEAIYGTGTVRFLLFASGIIGVIYALNKKETE